MRAIHRLCAVAITMGIALGAGIALADGPSLYAAGSLKTALGDVVRAYDARYGTTTETRFGPSGLMRKAIEEGGRPDVFASANMAHPDTLVEAGWGGPTVLFARNQLCGLARPGLTVTGDNFLDVLLDPEVRIGTSTPKADPSGDYAWELFGRAEDVRPGSFDVLSAKALKLTGGPDSAAPPAGRNPYAWVMDEDRADLFLTYCTNAVLAKRELPVLQIVDIPSTLAVGADYGLVVRADAEQDGWRLALFILSPESQEMLAGYGFEAAGVPR